MKTLAQREKDAKKIVDLFKNCEHKRQQDYTECCLDCGENLYSTPKEIYDREMGR